MKAFAFLGAGLAVVALSACAGSSPAPTGWQAVAGASQTWTSGPPQSAQQYSFETKSFSGTLQELASTEVIDVALQYHGAKFSGSDVYAPCPGLAAVATFSLGDRVLERGFSVANGKATLVTYIRAKSAAADAAATDAMQRVLCVMP